MRKIYQINQLLKYIFIGTAVIIVVVSAVFTNQLAEKLSVEETKSGNLG